MSREVWLPVDAYLGSHSSDAYFMTRRLGSDQWISRSLHGGTWTKVYRRAHQRAAERAELSLDLRMYALAISRAGANGHAPFDDGQLAALLPKLRQDTGEISLYTDRRLNQMIRLLVAAGLLGEPSTLRCLVVPLGVADSSAASTFACPAHGHVDAWQGDSNAGGGWVAIDPRTGTVVPPQDAA